METEFNPDTLLFNIPFLRMILIIPLAFLIYVLNDVYKQHKEKFSNQPLIIKEDVPLDDN